MLGQLYDKSRFDSDKQLFGYALQAYEHYWSLNPKPAHQDFSFTGVPAPTGTLNIGPNGGTPQFIRVNNVTYRWNSENRCQIGTIYPSK